MLQARRVGRGDRRDLWNWRNDAATVAASLSDSMVEWDEHELWFDKLLSDDARAMYLVENLEGAVVEKLGMCRFDLDTDRERAEVSINLNPLHRGKRLSAIVLHTAISAFHSEFGNSIELTATIRSENEPSTRLFASLGFVPVDSNLEVRSFVRTTGG